MAEREGEYKQVRLEEVIHDTQVRNAISALDRPWQPERTRLQIASTLAFGLLGLFALTISCSGIIIIVLIVASTVVNTGSNDPANSIEQMMKFMTTLLPYIATPLGVALGYFFRESRESRMQRE